MSPSSQLLFSPPHLCKGSFNFHSHSPHLMPGGTQGPPEQLAFPHAASQQSFLSQLGLEMSDQCKRLGFSTSLNLHGNSTYFSPASKLPERGPLGQPVPKDAVLPPAPSVWCGLRYRWQGCWRTSRATSAQPSASQRHHKGGEGLSSSSTPFRATPPAEEPFAVHVEFGNTSCSWERWTTLRLSYHQESLGTSHQREAASHLVSRSLGSSPLPRRTGGEGGTHPCLPSALPLPILPRHHLFPAPLPRWTSQVLQASQMAFQLPSQTCTQKEGKNHQSEGTAPHFLCTLC